MLSYLVLDVSNELAYFKQEVASLFKVSLPNSIIEELVYQVFDVFLNYGIRCIDDKVLNEKLAALPNNARVDLSLFLGEAYFTKANLFSNALLHFSSAIYQKLIGHVGGVKDFNFVINKIMHNEGRIILEYFPY